MNEKELKTSVGQRIAIIVIALMMLGGIIAGCAAMILNSKKSSGETVEITDEKMLEYETAYSDKLMEFQAASSGDWSKFSQYLGRTVAYDEEAANAGGVVTEDLLSGEGRTLAAGDNDYLAYYVGWCASGTVFDSSLDNVSEPKGFAKALDASLGMISGWTTGVIGMNLGGIRIITVPGEAAYGEQMEICGGYNKPLKFLVMAVANEDPLKTLAYEVDQAYLRVMYGYYGIDYDATIKANN